MQLRLVLQAAGEQAHRGARQRAWLPPEGPQRPRRAVLLRQAGLQEDLHVLLPWGPLQRVVCVRLEGIPAPCWHPIGHCCQAVTTCLLLPVIFFYTADQRKLIHIVN